MVASDRSGPACARRILLANDLALFSCKEVVRPSLKREVSAVISTCVVIEFQAMAKRAIFDECCMAFEFWIPLSFIEWCGDRWQGED